MKKYFLSIFMFITLFLIGSKGVFADVVAPEYTLPSNAISETEVAKDITSGFNTYKDVAGRGDYGVGYIYTNRADFYLEENASISLENAIKGQASVIGYGTVITISKNNVNVVFGGKATQNVNTTVNLAENKWYTIEVVTTLTSPLSQKNADALRMKIYIKDKNGNSVIEENADGFVYESEYRNRAQGINGVRYQSVGDATSYLANAYAYFTKIPHSVSVNSVSNGTITPSVNSAGIDDEVSVTVTPDKGYKLKSLSYSYVDGDNQTQVVDITSAKKFTMPLYDVTLSATFEKEEYTIVINPFTGATITPNNTVKVEYDGSQTYTIIPNDGYTLKSILVNNEEKISSLVNNKLTLSNITQNTTITIKTEAIQYEVVEGDKAEYNNEDLVFRINGDLSLFDKLYINGVELSDDYYTLASGSTIITLKNSYLKTLSNGTYTLKATYKNGTDVETTFTVNSSDKENSNSGSYSDAEKEIKNPVTGQKITGYVTVLVLSFAGFMTVVIRKLRRKTIRLNK